MTVRVRRPVCVRLRASYGERATGGGQVDEAQIRGRLEAARTAHRDLDAAIAALAMAGQLDQLQMARLKKQKLRLRDEIAALEDELIPDIIA